MVARKSTPSRRRLPGLAAVLCAATLTIAPLAAQTPDGMRQVMERLDRLEAQNRALAAEVDALKTELAAARGTGAAPGPTVEERVTVQETRTAEQAQSKVEASQRFPIRLTGMVLFNAYLNGNTASGFPVTVAGESSAGASFRQTVLGFDYNGPTTIWNGKVSGSLRMDFFGGSGHGLDQSLRFRTAAISVNWKNRSIMAGIDKPLIAQRDPESLAQVGISPLSGAGNLWLWLPQARFEQDFRIGGQARVRAQFAVIQTREVGGLYEGLPGTSSASASSVEPSRPGFETRVEFSGGTDRRIEIAPGFHRSVSHVAGASAPSDIVTVDWFARVWHPIEFSGTVFTGTNAAPLGGLPQGLKLAGPRYAESVHATGGWAQLTWRAAPRLWFNLFSGQEDDRNSDLPFGAVAKNLAYGANVHFRLAPNLISSFEASQSRVSYIQTPHKLRNYYDLALAYLF